MMKHATLKAGAIGLGLGALGPAFLIESSSVLTSSESQLAHGCAKSIGAGSVTLASLESGECADFKRFFPVTKVNGPGDTNISSITNTIEIGLPSQGDFETKAFPVAESMLENQARRQGEVILLSGLGFMAIGVTVNWLREI